MKTSEPPEQEYVEKIARSIREGSMRGACRRRFASGAVLGVLYALMAGGIYVAYLRLGGAKDDWHFVFGLVIGVHLCAGILVIGFQAARTFRKMTVQETKPFTLMIKYHDHLVREGLNPYES